MIRETSMRRSTWRQDSPIHQYRALRGSLEGSLLNAEEGIRPEESIQRALRVCEELRELEPFLQADPNAWTDPASRPA